MCLLTRRVNWIPLINVTFSRHTITISQYYTRAIVICKSRNMPLIIHSMHLSEYFDQIPLVFLFSFPLSHAHPSGHHDHGPGKVDSKGVEGTGAMAIKRAGCTSATHGVGACTAVVLPWWRIRRLSYMCTWQEQTNPLAPQIFLNIKDYTTILKLYACADNQISSLFRWTTYK